MQHTTVLTGEHLTLRPLALGDAPALAALVDAPSWRAMTVPLPGPEPVKAEAFIASALADPARMAFALDVGGRLRGFTGYHDHAPAQLATFVGFTYYAPELRGDGVTNAEAKLLLLSHAFDELGFVRVGLRADGENAHSLAAIAKLGAVREGTMRSHMVRPSGGRRDTVLFSVLADEWAGVKAGLQARLGR